MMFTWNKGRKLVLLFTAIILSIPLIAKQMTPEVDWGPVDFLVAGILLLASGFTVEYILRKVPSRRKRIAFCTLVALALLLIWAELAVGVLGTAWGGH